MSFQIDALLKRKEYDIYNNANISDECIKKIAETIIADKSIDLKEYFNLLKCSFKFCWLNYLNVLEKMPDEDKIRGIPVLFELLKDSNWPTYQKTMELFGTIDKQAVKTYSNEYLAQAHAENDEMWIENIRLIQNMIAKPTTLTN